jgi:hypothetical protein
MRIVKNRAELKIPICNDVIFYVYLELHLEFVSVHIIISGSVTSHQH